MDQKKLQYLKTQIQEAQNALKNWSDRKAEVAIELDSIFCDVQQLEIENQQDKDASARNIAELKAKLASTEEEFHATIEAYTNEMLEFKNANENLSRQLKEARNEIESQNKAQKKMEIDFAAKIAQVESQAEIRVADEQYQLKNQVSDLVAQLQMIVSEKQNIAEKAIQYERELQAIRSSVLNVLRVSDVPVPANSAANAGSSSNAQNGANTQNSANSDHGNRGQKLTAVEISTNQLSGNALPETVNDYLKRFGY